jgi:sec-independent protein translocase protein TatA
MFGNLGGGEIFLILLIILIFFGPKKIPEIAKGLGQGIREFRKASRDIQDQVEKEISHADDKKIGPAENKNEPAK